VEENAGAGAIELSMEALDVLETAFPLRDWPGSLPMI
jgi:hypothetical protein